MTSRPARALGLLLFLAAALCRAAPDDASEQRTIYVISDLHMGLGRVEAAPGEEASWSRTEDFRWPRALAGFLDEIAPADGGAAVDLVIAGDFLELWQPPPEIECPGPAEDRDNYGCTVDEMVDITRQVLAGHADELAVLAEFAARGTNCLHIVPGNHDAALVLDPVWALLEEKLRPADDGGQSEGRGGCVERAVDGLWVSGDGLVVVEHGHQIGQEANRYRDWPRITKSFAGVDYVERPWGERFVQKNFNDEEAGFPLIDNLSPKSAGLRYRFAERGLGGSVADAAQFLKFNLLDTSWRQKGAVLGKGQGAKKEERWDVARGRDLGHKLFAHGLPEDDPFRSQLLDGDGEWADLRAQLDLLAGDAERLPDTEVEGLCDQLEAHGGAVRCQRVQLGALGQKIFLGHGRVVREHLEERQGLARFKKTRIFAYGHTHEFEHAWSAKIGQRKKATVLNSGAFQRLVDDEGLKVLAAAQGVSEAKVLESGSLELLEPCYTVVQIERFETVLTSRVRAWVMDEGAVAGRFDDPCGPSCPTIGNSCRKRRGEEPAPP